MSALVASLEDAKLNKDNRRIDVTTDLGPGTGGTIGGFFDSRVYLSVLFPKFKSAFDCGAGNDCEETAFGDMPQKTGFSRGLLAAALGRGIGATGAHEVGHQQGVFCARPFTFDVPCTNCYDYKGTLGRWPRVYFLGPLEWSPRAREAMWTALPRP
jgi:hypothetical protein